jgi:ABC-2 type transport system ATP-binding protein
LEGSIREVKRSFGRNAVGLRMTGGEEVLADTGLISSIKRDSDGIEVLLAPEANAQQLLARLVSSGASIEKFEMIEPSLNDIFIQKVTETV